MRARVFQDGAMGVLYREGEGKAVDVAAACTEGFRAYNKIRKQPEISLGVKVLTQQPTAERCSGCKTSRRSVNSRVACWKTSRPVV